MMQRGDFLAFTVSVLVHLLVAGLILFKWQSEPITKPAIIKATLVDAKMLENRSKNQKKYIETAVEKVRQKTPPEPIKEEKTVREPEQTVKPKIELQKKSVAAQREQQLREKRKLKKIQEKELALKKSQEREQKRKQAQEKAKKEAQLKAEQEKQQAAQKKLAEQKKKDAARKKAEQERRSQEEALASSLAEEQSSTDTRLVSLYIKIIEKRIRSNWSQPSSESNIVALLRIKLSPNGNLLSVELIRSSGNTAFDRSIINAVKKSDRFPEVAELPANVFNNNFQDFEIKFRPDIGGK